MSDMMMISSTNSWGRIWWDIPPRRIPSVVALDSSSLALAFFGYKTKIRWINKSYINISVSKKDNNNFMFCNLNPKLAGIGHSL